jgi:hypothetical protein
MTDMNPYNYAAGGAFGGALAFVGKWFIKLITDIIARADARGDRLEAKLFELQALILPALESSASAIREAISAKKEG